MATDLIINATSYEVRIALIEHGDLVEFYLERPSERGLVGNIYHGRVVRVLPGMQAAFVEIGLSRTGFLYVDDVNVETQEIDNLPAITNGDFDEQPPDSLSRREPGMSIDDLLVEGQEILVQISKEPIGSKGARLTCNITLPCRNLVFMPMTDHIGVSRKIEDEDLRQKFKEDIEELRPADTGFIVRTVAESATREDFEADMEFLLNLWSDIQAEAAKPNIPSLVYEDLDIILRVVRDVFSPTVDRVVVDEINTYNRVLRFVENFAPRLSKKVHYFSEKTPVFDAYGIEMEINRALNKKVWLRCGGYIVIEATEALTVIDVNTGRYVGKNDLEDTIFKTNIEAAKEIAYQLRLKNIGGIIIVDFIDMEQEFHREEVVRILTESVKKDKCRVNILKVSEFGLVQMTRKRSREDLHRMMCEPCLCCRGDGFVKSRRTICYEIFRKLSLKAPDMPGEKACVCVSPPVAALMLKEEADMIHQIEDEVGKQIVIIPDKDIPIEKFEIVWDNT
nr:Rne/Rng family ribonuclease [Desulfobulbaceae bacterium]